jgi:hypothetical protein
MTTESSTCPSPTPEHPDIKPSTGAVQADAEQDQLDELFCAEPRFLSHPRLRERFTR